MAIPATLPGHEPSALVLPSVRMDQVPVPEDRRMSDPFLSALPYIGGAREFGRAPCDALLLEATSRPHPLMAHMTRLSSMPARTFLRQRLQLHPDLSASEESANRASGPNDHTVRRVQFHPHRTCV